MSGLLHSRAADVIALGTLAVLYLGGAGVALWRIRAAEVQHGEGAERDDVGRAAVQQPAHSASVACPGARLSRCVRLSAASDT
ncbi:hypothetical protein A8E72_07715 [Burkholderia cenocepacia]|uniref:Uncharacterized protein n=1 Tax=Burkholderia cenocepacia TaxID=95486 RepID=A0A1V2W870_9BURK|nr:hypothetical protein A8E72_07715 [Burkholderia cenocepacia]